MGTFSLDIKLLPLFIESKVGHDDAANT